MQVQPIQPNKPQPSFGIIYKNTKITHYGKCIEGTSRGYNYSVYVSEDKNKNIAHKLYYITKDNKWVKSVLKLFSNNKMYKEIRSKA